MCLRQPVATQVTVRSDCFICLGLHHSKKSQDALWLEAEAQRQHMEFTKQLFPSTRCSTRRGLRDESGMTTHSNVPPGHRTVGSSIK